MRQEDVSNQIMILKKYIIFLVFKILYLYLILIMIYDDVFFNRTELERVGVVGSD